MDTQELTADDRRRLVKAKARRQTLACYLFLTPYILLLLMFGVFPVFYAFGLSFTDAIEGGFYGFTNYAVALGDFRVPPAIFNIITFVAVWVTATVIGVTGLSLMLDAIPRRVATVLRTVYFLPGAVTSSAIVVLWLFMLDPAVSPFQSVFHLLGWNDRFSVIGGLHYQGIFALMAFFATSGGWIVVISGALAGLPGEVLEAARIDGANRWQLATRIKVPMLWRSVALMAILCMAGGLQIFVEPQLLSLAGGQFSVPDWSLNQLAFQYAFSLGDFGVSAAMITVVLAVSIGIAFIIVFATRFYRIN